MKAVPISDEMRSSIFVDELCRVTPADELVENGDDGLVENEPGVLGDRQERDTRDTAPR